MLPVSLNFINGDPLSDRSKLKVQTAGRQEPRPSVLFLLRKPPFIRKPPLVCPRSETRGGLSYKSAEGRNILGDFPPVLLRKTLLKRCFCNGKSVFGSPKSQNFPPAAG